MAFSLSNLFPSDLFSSFSTRRSNCSSPFSHKARSFSLFLAISPFFSTAFYGLSKLSSTRTSHASNVAERIHHREHTRARRTRDEMVISANDVQSERGTVTTEKSTEPGSTKQMKMGFHRPGGRGTSRKVKKKAPWVRRKRENEERSSKKKSNRTKLSGAQLDLRVKLDMCSKRGDVMGAIALYDSSASEAIELGQYHYNVLLYLCSAAAIGIIHPAKSGSGSSSGLPISSPDPDYSSEESSSKQSEDSGEDWESVHEEQSWRIESAVVEDSRGKETRIDGAVIRVSEEIREYARSRGLEIYEKMHLEKIPMSEAALTSVARIAMSMGNGEMAFEVAKKMKPLGITSKLRSYGPALLTFCNTGNIDRAFEVEAHMLDNGVQPEEPELEALLKVSIAAQRGEKVYYLLHKLRTNVRQVSSSTARLIEAWFKSVTASRVGKRKWDVEEVAEAIENGGGGWHGLGWLGKGKWNVSHALVNVDGVCMTCRDKLVTLDLDPAETENFAKSVASLANKRERNSNFQKFQEWLDYYGPFEAVVDAANVGLFSNRQFSVRKVNAVVNAIRQKLPMKRWPLIIVHNKRLTGDKMNEPMNMKILDKWKNADAIYETPTGSNDDWYWLYAAIKFKCLIVTNDEMRDHIFQVLGNDFFPKWKERHQVHFSFHDGSFEFDMPPPCSIVIQENERGHWHIPIRAEQEEERKRTWLCATRACTHAAIKETSSLPIESSTAQKTKGSLTSRFEAKNHVLPKGSSKEETIRSSPMCSVNGKTKESQKLVSDIEAAEKLCGRVIDFQI